MAIFRLAFLMYLGLVLASAQMMWVQSTGGSTQMCAGILSSCSSMATCTEVSYGPCGGVAAGNAPPWYFQSSVVGIAVISGSDTGYLTNGDLVTMLKPASVDNNQYMATVENATVGVAKVATVTNGAFMSTASSPATPVAYLGMAAVLIKSGTFSSNTVPVMVATKAGSSSTSLFDTCISPVTNGACGAKLDFPAGAFKFSLFGNTLSGYAKSAGATYLGFRTLVKIMPSSVTVTGTLNRGVPLANNNGINVTSLTITANGNTASLYFPQTYNVGTVGATGPNAPTATRNVVIKVTSAEANQVYIDYLFATSDFPGPDCYFIYDPTVQQTKPVSASGASPIFGLVEMMVPLLVLFANLF